jgi:hypothetical protein
VLPPPPPPPPQPATAATAASTSIAKTVSQRRFCSGKLSKKREASAKAALTPIQMGRLGPREGMNSTCDEAVVVQLNVEVPEAALELKVIEDGMNEQAGESTAPLGPATDALKLTEPLKPLLAFAVTTVLAVAPGSTLAAVGLALMVNAPQPVPVTVMLEGAESLGPKVPFPA